MFPLRYIHAADLHLDAPFRGLRHKSSNVHPDLPQILQKSTFTALERLVTLCERERPDFLVIAGDIYDEEDQSIKSHLSLRDACLRLQKIKLPIFMVHGNHDPVNSRLKSIQWPENTYIFPAEMEVKGVKSNTHDSIIALVHGISHASNKESRNIVTSFSRVQGEHMQVFQLGLVHCALDCVPPADRYAPCSLADMKNTGLDAFALGHVHERRMVNENPFVLYAGNTQGLQINEEGERGCYVVDVKPQGKGKPFAINSTFHCLGSVIWKKLTINADNVHQAHELEERIVQGIDELIAQTPMQCEALIVRIILTGHTELDGELRYKNFSADLMERIQSTLKGHPIVWLKDMCVETLPNINMAELAERDDLLGETMRLGVNLQNDNNSAQNFVQKAVAPLYGYARAKQHLAKLSEDESMALLEDAKRLCADIMESR